MADDSPSNSDAAASPTRRDFLYVVTAAFAGIGATASLVPMVGQMEPDARTLAAGGPVEFDASKLQPGQQAVVRWRSRPVFIVNRPPAALKTLQDASFVSRLSDPQSTSVQQPPYATNWHRSIDPAYGVLVGICTHLGCIPLFYPDPNAEMPAAGWRGGYFCPCHGSKYDLAGRVFAGVPAPYNLPVPPYRLINDTIVRIGENPPDADWDFASIMQI
ncbi:Ubiquinol-cytochrome c reductase iron-sulfur subunit (Rieske iron-sulfur protein) (RISP) [Bradyrhizobium sp. ORS 375]|uniref:ubiquinol-cytochrome c reductase iron-sulfur subunit n=1 Tax=Bradyrhizobium sp. (strain ORS 375) TaxID=566679 RepID=UPI0002407AE7|nr:ubiquinol-cytochrome c reductase iron-sulfur subunit [Bradyrhizobium sp. ORS 375]CCD95737.1 Ubiquinol-cytochrome c reductase iron-sulfur subunit (Rieske iron-sulfur protein) (RISP) [Bradyrhizobium sp. ORS 375]